MDILQFSQINPPQRLLMGPEATSMPTRVLRLHVEPAGLASTIRR